MSTYLTSDFTYTVCTVFRAVLYLSIYLSIYLLTNSTRAEADLPTLQRQTHHSVPCSALYDDPTLHARAAPRFR